MGELFVRDSEIVAKSENVENPVTGSEKKEVAQKGTGKIKKQGVVLYSHDEAVEASREYFMGDDLAARVWANKYALKDSFGNLFENNTSRMICTTGWLLKYTG